jgi:hypothetical protein
MRTKTYYLGRNIGWDLAGTYATGTRIERRAIRSKLGRLAASSSQFAEGVWEGFSDRAEQRAEAIMSGTAARTINPHKLKRVLERVA